MSVFDALKIGQAPDPMSLAQTQLWVLRMLAFCDDISVHGAQHYHRESARHLLGWASELRIKRPPPKEEKL